MGGPGPMEFVCSQSRMKRQSGTSGTRGGWPRDRASEGHEHGAEKQERGERARRLLSRIEVLTERVHFTEYSRNDLRHGSVHRVPQKRSASDSCRIQRTHCAPRTLDTRAPHTPIRDNVSSRTR